MPTIEDTFPVAGSLDDKCWRVIGAAGKGPLLVDVRLHPEDADELKADQHAVKNSRVTWDGPDSSPVGGLRYCGYRILSDGSVPRGVPAVVVKPD